MAFAALNATNVRAVIIIPEGFTQSLTFKNATVSITVDKSNPDIANIVTNGVMTAFSEFYKNAFNYTEPITFTIGSAVPGQVIGYKET